MTGSLHEISQKSGIIALAFCLFAAMLTPTASADPVLTGASGCGSTGATNDIPVAGTAMAGPVDNSPASTNGSVGQVIG